MSDSLPEMILYAGEVTSWAAVATNNDDGTAFDLTGCTVHFTAKRSLTDSDSDAILNVAQTSHSDAAAGETTIPIDLSGVSDHIKSKGATLTGDIWLVDSSGNKIPQGLIKVTVKAAATKTF